MTRWAAPINPGIINTNNTTSTMQGSDNSSGIDRIAQMDIDDEFLKFFDAYQKAKVVQTPSIDTKPNTGFQREGSAPIPSTSTYGVQENSESNIYGDLECKTLKIQM